MRSRFVKLFVVLMLAVAIPAGAAIFNYNQYWDVSDSGSWAVMIYNYNNGDMDILVGSGSGSIAWGLPYYAWYAFCLYDFSTGSWDEFIYLYDEAGA
jgi:hypothetical protein